MSLDPPDSSPRSPINKGILELSLEEKIEKWKGWDDSNWRPDWQKAYSRTVGWAVIGGISGALHSLATGRAIFINSVVFCGYTSLISGCYYTSREAFFGREIERFHQESLALGLPESTARDYPWRWDMLCGAIPGALVGAMSGKGTLGMVVGATVFSTGALAVRASSKSVSDYILPVLLPQEARTFEKSVDRVFLSDDDLDKRDETKAKEEKNKKGIIAELLPTWSPVQVWTSEELEKKEKDKQYAKWLEREIEAARISVGIKRKVKELEEELETKGKQETVQSEQPKL